MKLSPLPKGAKLLPVTNPHHKPHAMRGTTELKHCAYCDTWWSLGHFWAHAGHWDGLQAHCKECTLEQITMSQNR